jgi:hypothetical protein
VLICYDFHFGIFVKEEDLMFAIEPRLFSIGSIYAPTLVKSEQPISLISSTGLNLVEHVFILLVLYDKPIELLYVLLVWIAISLKKKTHNKLKSTLIWNLLSVPN